MPGVRLRRLPLRPPSRGQGRVREPLWAGYEDELASKIADLNNVAASPLAGAIFGALFLNRFVSEYTRWVLVDLYDWNSKDRPGRGVYRYLVQRYGTV